MKTLILLLAIGSLHSSFAEANVKAMLARKSMLYQEFSRDGDLDSTQAMEDAVAVGVQEKSHATLFCARMRAAFAVISAQGISCEVMDLKTGKFETIVGYTTEYGGFAASRHKASWSSLKSLILDGSKGSLSFMPSVALGLSIGYVRGDGYFGVSSLLTNKDEVFLGIEGLFAAGWGAGAEWYSINTIEPDGSYSEPKEHSVQMGFVSGYLGDMASFGIPMMQFFKVEDLLDN